jgi:leader peptidase (prepilin peptidase)/N-methyltransferase
MELSVVSPPSRCPHCEHRIRWYENVPLLSWMALRARCAGCRAPISPIYPAVELIVALGWLASFVAFGATFEAVNVAVFATVLLGVAVTDAKHYLIPDGFTVFGFLWALGASVAGALLGESSHFAGPLDAFLGACVGAGSLSIIGWLGEVALKKEAMGFGDVTLMAVIGAALGPTRALLAVGIAAVLGAIVFPLVVYPIAWLRSRRAGTPFERPMVPFGVFLAPAALLTLLWGTLLIDWYTQRMLTQ